AVTGTKRSTTSTNTGAITVAPPPPVASFTANPTSGQAPLAVTFTDTSTGTPTAWAWTFGDGTSSTAQSPTRTYSAAGTYTVQLTATNAGGSTTATGTITVTAPVPTTGHANLPWAAVSAANLSGYRLDYGQTSQTYTAHVDAGLQPAATVSGLTVGQTYYFAVTAVDSTGKGSPFSDEVSTTIAATATASISALSAD